MIGMELQYETISELPGGAPSKVVPWQARSLAGVYQPDPRRTTVKFIAGIWKMRGHACCCGPEFANLQARSGRFVLSVQRMNFRTGIYVADQSR